jgi:predicted CXXCH cytochrome family protein
MPALGECRRVQTRFSVRMLSIFGSLAILLAGCSSQESDPGDFDSVATTAQNGSTTGGRAGIEGSLEFIGSERCVECHPAQSELWTASDHDRAMELPSEQSVEGNFDDQVLEYFDETWRFTRDAREFVVERREAGGESQRWPVAYTFGVVPLQQYLVAFPNGRYQALPVAWDSRPAADGGQRWFHLSPDEQIPRGDPVHWEGIAYNWNAQCASCHSTQLEKRYDAETDGFDTRFAEIDVGCEACHGPASRHVERMTRDPEAGIEGPEGLGLRVLHDAWEPTRWQRHSDSRIAAPTHPREHDNEIDTCAPCHSRRSVITELPEVGAPLLDGYRPALLDSGLYFEDGQIHEEVYVYGSFLQSRMFAAGVRCSDCHDPHSLSLRREGNALCEGCHSADTYASSDHHGHERDGDGGSCVACHMPERVYMEIDARRDHAFVLPRPLRSQSLGAPSACESCHAERDAVWAETQIESWRGQRPAPENWADRLVREGSPRNGAEAWLETALDPIWTSIVRGSAWSRYAQQFDVAVPLEVLKKRVAEGSDLEKLGLVNLGGRLSFDARFALLSPLLDDERRAVRIAAAEALADLPPQIGRPADRSRLARALREYRQAQEANAERPEAQVNLGSIAGRLGDAEGARAAYERAMKQAPYFVPAYVNLADLERALGRDEESLARLREAVEMVPEDAMVRYALGLALHRSGRSEEALEELAEAAKAAPEQSRLVLAWALSLDAAGRRAEAIARLSEAVDRGLEDPDLYQALATLLRDAGEGVRARAVALEWSQRFPEDDRAKGLLGQLGGQG